MRVTIAVISLLIASAVSAPQKNATSETRLKLESSALKSQMTTEELEYILKTKSRDAREPPKKLSPCARAILGCCNDAKVMNSHCSESLNCGAFFFDDNPCEEEFVISALNAAHTFYKQFD